MQALRRCAYRAADSSRYEIKLKPINFSRICLAADSLSRDPACSHLVDHVVFFGIMFVEQRWIGYDDHVHQMEAAGWLTSSRR